MTGPTTETRAQQHTSVPRRMFAFVATLAVLAFGVLAMGRLADDDVTAMLLTGAWFTAVLAIGGWLVWRRRRDLWLPLGAAFALGSVAVTVLVGLPTLIDRTVDEAVVTADQTGVTQTSTGSFVPLAHPGSGTATVLTDAAGQTTLTLTGFATDPGPDLRVYLTAGDPAADEELRTVVDLGALKGNVGDQQYVIPAGTDLAGLDTVVIWCRAFDVAFTSAALR
jgi:Electron transfer DM13